MANHGFYTEPNKSMEDAFKKGTNPSDTHGVLSTVAVCLDSLAKTADVAFVSISVSKPDTVSKFSVSLEAGEEEYSSGYGCSQSITDAWDTALSDLQDENVIPIRDGMYALAHISASLLAEGVSFGTKVAKDDESCYYVNATIKGVEYMGKGISLIDALRDIQKQVADANQGNEGPVITDDTGSAGQAGI